MAKPDLGRLYAGPKGQIFKQGGSGLSTLEVSLTVQRLILKRVEGLFGENEPLDLTAPGFGWLIFGDAINVENEADLLTNIKIYRNGQLLIGNNSFSPDFDFYFIEKNKIAFIFSIRTSEVLQISKNFKDM